MLQAIKAGARSSRQNTSPTFQPVAPIERRVPISERRSITAAASVLDWKTHDCWCDRLSIGAVGAPQSQRRRPLP